MTTIKNYFSELKKIDKKFLGVLIFSTIVPIIYAYLRLLWVAGDSSESYAMTSFSAYIKAFTEVFTAFIIFPMFSYRKQEYQTKSNSLLFSVFLATILLAIILLSTNPFTLKKMMILNPDASKKELLTYLRIISLSNAIEVFETYLIYEIALAKETNKGIFITSASLLLKIIVDLVLISDWAIIDFNIINVAISSLISSIIIITLLLTWYFIKQNKTITLQKIKYSEMLEFYRRGFYPGLQKTIGNFFYSFVTLAIVNNLGEVGWNSWHLGSWIFWHVVFKITNVFEYSLLSETINNEEINSRKLTKIYILFDIITFFVLVPILTFTTLPHVVDNDEWLRLSSITALMMMLPFLATSIGSKLKVKMLLENKFKYILIGTIISNFLINIPIYIALLLGKSFNYLDNYIFYCLVDYLTFLVDLIFYLAIVNNQTTIEFLKINLFSEIFSK